MRFMKRRFMCFMRFSLPVIEVGIEGRREHRGRDGGSQAVVDGPNSKLVKRGGGQHGFTLRSGRPLPHCLRHVPGVGFVEELLDRIQGDSGQAIAVADRVGLKPAIKRQGEVEVENEKATAFLADGEIASRCRGHCGPPVCLLAGDATLHATTFAAPSHGGNTSAEINHKTTSLWRPCIFVTCYW